MKLRLKLLSAFLMMAIMLIAAGIWSINGFKLLEVSVQGILDENYRSILASQKMVEAVEREDSAILLLMQGYWERGRYQLMQSDSVFNEAFQIARGNITIEGEAELLNTIQQHYQAYKDIWERPIVDTDREGNWIWYEQSAHRAFQVLKNDLKGLAGMNEDSMYETASNLETMAERSIMPGIVAIIATFILTSMFAYFVSALIVSPILRMTDRVRAFREGGDLNKLDIHTHDEIGDLADEIRLLAKHHSRKGQV
ncbi:MAG: HAMP domain-containing protein [Candidatus Marinimicrobia bacterium]|nr:HAMP domain-containing protein [Candidatus Neomarinimicrobiota bacterium]